MSVLNDLFSQILQSEEKIKERFEQLKNVNNKIIDYQSKIKDAEFEVESLQGTLAVKNQRLVEEEVELKWLNVREQILMSQKQNMDQERKKVSQDVEKIRDILDTERKKFIEQCSQFSLEYDLFDTGGCEFEKQLEAELQSVKEERQKTLKELENFRKQLEEIKQLQRRYEDFQNVIINIKKQNEEAESRLHRAQIETHKLMKEKDMASWKSHYDGEFKRLAKELELCQKKSAQLNNQRQGLFREIYTLQQKVMEQESQRSRKGRGNNVTTTPLCHANKTKSLGCQPFSFKRSNLFQQAKQQEISETVNKTQRNNSSFCGEEDMFTDENEGAINDSLYSFIENNNAAMASHGRKRSEPSSQSSSSPRDTDAKKRVRFKY